MGQQELGAKTVLYLIDGLYGGYYWEGTPYRWTMPPFNGDWPSSLFVSQDPVAIDSVAYDFLYAEWPDVVEGGTGDPGVWKAVLRIICMKQPWLTIHPPERFMIPKMMGRRWTVWAFTSTGTILLISSIRGIRDLMRDRADFGFL